MKQRIHSVPLRWICFSVLLLSGTALWLAAPGYRFSGIFLASTALLIPIHTLLSHISNAKWRKRFLIAESLILTLFIVAMGITCGFIVHSGHGSPAPDAPYLVVLGAGVNGTTPSRSLQERINRAYDYLVSHPDAVAIVSGGQGSGEDISEALCMYQALTDLGMESQRIWMEDQATSTLENLRYSLEVIRDHTGTKPERIAIVSSEYHLHRAALFARRLGVDCDLVPAKTASVTLRMNYYMREIFALWYYTLLGGTHYV